jgi:uncharacterized iron-regulated membrane protein
LYRAVWRWHFYAGVFCIPIIVILSLSGIVYLFRSQVHEVVYGGMMNVERGQETVSYEQQLATVRAAYPDAEVVRVVTPRTATKATQFDLDTGTPLPGFAAGNQTVFVDPYTGEITGRRDNGNDPVQVANQIHGSLMSGHWLGAEKWGDRIIELVGSWTVVLVVTGVFLWWPRGRSGKSLKGTLIPRFNVRSARVKWRDIHAVTGVLFSFVFLFFMVTGLAWTGFWGANYQKVATDLGADYGDAFAGASSETIGDRLGEGRVGWAASTLPVLPSGQPVGAPNSGGELTWDPTKPAPLDAIIATIQAEGVPPGFKVSLPVDEKDSYYAFYGFENGQGGIDEKILYVDQYSAKPLADFHLGDFGPMAQATEVGIAFHEGDELGLFGQFLSLTGALAVLVSAATACVMWYKRRPKGVGAPRRVYSQSALAGLTLITVTLGILFPLVGMSLIALLIFDFAILRRVPPLARAFGAV